LGNYSIESFLIKALVLFIAFPVYGFAKAYVAYRLGDDTAKRNGMMTLNPLVHLEPMGAIFMVLFGIGWGKPVNVNYNNFKVGVSFKKGLLLTTLAGPCAMLLLGLISVGILQALPYSADELAAVFLYIALLSIGLAIFTLIPIPPFAGSALLLLANPELYMKAVRYQMYLFIGLILILNFDATSYWFYWIEEQILTLFVYLTNWIGLIFH
jgi:Zn-dependent protease